MNEDGKGVRGISSVAFDKEMNGPRPFGHDGPLELEGDDRNRGDSLGILT